MKLNWISCCSSRYCIFPHSNGASYCSRSELELHLTKGMKKQCNEQFECLLRFRNRVTELPTVEETEVDEGNGAEKKVGH